jgi:hypothetical protein
MNKGSGIKNRVQFRLTGTPDGDLLVTFYHLDVFNKFMPIKELQTVEGKQGGHPATQKVLQSTKQCHKLRYWQTEKTNEVIRHHNIY